MLTRAQTNAARAVAVLAAASRLFAVARSPWDWDEMLFCLAMRGYDVAQHHPHPPGFPLFIALAKIVRFVILDDFRALQAVVVVASFFVFPAVLMLGRELGLRAETAIAGAALCAFFPNVWFFGGTAFSDVPSIVLATFAAALLLRGRRSPRAYVAGALLLAAAAAIRPQNLLVGLFPAVAGSRGLAVAQRQRQKDRSSPLAPRDPETAKLRNPVAAALFGGALILGAFFGGAIAATGGPGKYMTAVRVHGDYIARTDSFRSPTRPPLWRLADDFFVHDVQPPALAWIAALFVAASLAYAVRTRDRAVGALVLTFGPFALFAWLMLDRFSVSRFSIGYAPMTALLLAHGIAVVARRAQPIAAGIFCIAFIAYTLPALSIVRREDSPPVRAVRAARSVGGEHPLYVAHSMEPFAESFLRRRPYLRVNDERSLPMGSPAARAWKLTELAATSPRELTFRRAHGRLWNIARRHYFDVALAPVDALPQFGAGWYPPERAGLDEWRWTAGRATVQLPPMPPGPALFAIEFDIPDHLRPPLVTLTLNGVVIDSFRPGTGRLRKEYGVTAAAANTLEIAVAPTYNSVREKTGDDPREVGILVRELSWGPP